MDMLNEAARQYRKYLENLGYDAIKFMSCTLHDFIDGYDGTMTLPNTSTINVKYLPICKKCGIPKKVWDDYDAGKIKFQWAQN